MKEALILHVETATNICSVALSKGSALLAIRETDEDRSHGSVLTVFMDEVLKESGLKPADINAVAVSKGPGSYTGLRIGVSVTKGFAYAQNIPVIGVSTLSALALAAQNDSGIHEFQKKHSDYLLCPMIDARRLEVYTALYSGKGEEIDPVSAKIIDENSYSKLLDSTPIAFFGNGSDKLTSIIKHENAHFFPGITPSARYMIPLTHDAYLSGSFEDTAYFEPFYLKDFVATIPKKKIL